MAAAFTVSPSTPLNTQPITLDATPSLPTSGVTLGYEWSVGGATTYNGCPSAKVCVIPGDALNPGQHQITLVVTNLDNGTDQSVALQNVNVADGSVNPDFTWSPTSPEIGESVRFDIGGVFAEIQQATWNFGGPGCTGYSQTTVCTPSLFNDCTSMVYKYASGGSKTVTLVVRVADQNFTATPKTITVQNTGTCSGGGCSYELTSATTSFGASGGTGTVSVSTTAGCTWQATKTGSWISFTGNTSGSGSGSIPFSVAANSGSARSGQIAAADQSIAITQDGASCTYSLSPGMARVPSSGGTDTFEVQAGPGCPWTATSTRSWLRITGGASGEGNGTVRWVADPNGTTASRTGTILVADQIFTVEQSSPSTPTDFTISNSGPQIGETVLLTVTGGEPVTWDMGGRDCDGRGPTIDCEGDIASCMNMAWAWATPGVKSVRLFGTYGSKTRIVSVLTTGSCAPCTAVGPPTAAISISPNPAGIGEVVTFNDASTGGPTGWSWSVRLGGSEVATSNQRSFALVLDHTGNYVVNLTSSNCRGFSTTTATLTIRDQPSVRERVIAGAAHVDGLFGTSWRTDLAVFNPSASPVNITLEPDGDSQTAGAVPVLAFGLAPGATRLLEDVLGKPPLGDGGPRKSSLILKWEGGGSAAPTVAARTFNQTPTGSYGQYLPAVTPSPTAPAEQWLTGLADNQAFRTNLLLVNLDDDDATAVSVELLDSTGSLIGEITNLTVPGRSSLQLVGLAARAGIDVQVDLYSARVLTRGAHLFASASVIDNLSGDPIQYLAAHEWPSRLWLPGLAHLAGANGSTWRSDLVLANPGASSLSLTVELVPETSIGFTPMLRVELEPGESIRLEDLVGPLAGTEAAVKGFLRVTVDAQSSGGPLVSARTFNLSTNGTFGQAIPAVSEANSIPSGWRGCLPGFRGSASPNLGYRTNLGLLNISSSETAVVNIRLFDTTGSEIATVLAYPVASASSVQFNLLDAAGLGGRDVVGSVTLEVVSGGPISGYLSVIDNRTQDPILVPATLCGSF